MYRLILVCLVALAFVTVALATDKKSRSSCLACVLPAKLEQAQPPAKTEPAKPKAKPEAKPALKPDAKPEAKKPERKGLLARLRERFKGPGPGN